MSFDSCSAMAWMTWVQMLDGRRGHNHPMSQEIIGCPRQVRVH